MSWFRFDDQKAFDASVIIAGNEAFGAWCRAGQWASSQRTDGAVPEQVARQIAPSRVWQKLIAAGLILQRATSAEPYRIVGFLDYNQSREQAIARREQLSEVGRRGGIASGAIRKTLAMEGSEELKDATRRVTSFAIMQGKIQRQPCSVCGERSADAHHRDYSDPYDLDWLCDAHHADTHARLRAERREAIENGVPDPVPTQEEPEERVASLAPSPAAPAYPSQATPPSTTRSPATLPTDDPWGLAPTPNVTASPTKLRKPRAAKPVIALLTVDALTPDERAVHDAIVQDVTLVQICHNIPQLARDLLVIANGRLDVVAKVRDLGAWNRNNPSKAWTTAGGNKGLTGCVKRDASKASFGYPSTLPTPYAAPVNHHYVAAPRTQHFAPPPPPRVDLKGVDGEETFLERMARTDPQAKKIIDRMAK